VIWPGLEASLRVLGWLGSEEGAKFWGQGNRALTVAARLGGDGVVVQVFG
jgi:hypothetical protein